MREIKPPTQCPSCNSDLVWLNNLLYCHNPTCKNKLTKCIIHFVKSLKIKGLGPVAISKLGLTYISDIYLLTQPEIAAALSSEKLATKLAYEIENSKRVDLNRLLPAFSIPLIGRSASEKLSKVCDHIYDITEISCREAGLGPKATENLLNWKKFKLPLLEELPFSFKFKKLKTTEIKGIICISGRLNTYKTKAEATSILEGLGYIVKNTLTQQVSILINESGIESSKTKRARSSGITIVTNLKDFIGE